jgi:hypothetical protein
MRIAAIATSQISTAAVAQSASEGRLTPLHIVFPALRIEAPMLATPVDWTQCGVPGQQTCINHYVWVCWCFSAGCRLTPINGRHLHNDPRRFCGRLPSDMPDRSAR